MDIPSMLYELDEINTELSRLKKIINKYNKRKTELTNDIVHKMKEEDNDSITFKGRNYKVEEITHCVRKSDKKRREDSLNLLIDKGYNKNDAEELYNEISNTLRGNKKVKYRLK